MNNRDILIDLIKIIAMFSVISLHSFGASSYWRCANVFYETGVIGIPLFFMVSGFLLLGRQTVDWNYVFKKILHIIRLVFLLSLLIWVLKCLLSGTLNLGEMLNIFLGAFVQEGPLWMCWFLGTLIILYVILPIVNKIYINNILSFVSICFLLFVIENCIFCELIGGGNFEKEITQTFRLWNWIFYFMLGGLIKKNIHLKMHIPKLYVPLIMLLIINIVFQERMKKYIDSPYCEFFYSSFPVVILSILVFLFICKLNLKNSLIQQVINFLSPLFLPIYLFHPFFVRIIHKLLLPYSLMPYVCFVLVSIMSILFGFIISKFKWAHWLIKI